MLNGLICFSPRLGYPPSGDQPATIHRIKPTPTSTTTENIYLPEASRAAARLVSTDESKIQGTDDISSSTTPSTTVNHLPIHNKQQKVIDETNPVVVEVISECPSSTSSSANYTVSATAASSSNCQNYQNLVGILSTPPILNNSIMATVAAEAIATSPDESIQPQNPIHRLSLEGQQHESSFAWSREDALCESKFIQIKSWCNLYKLKQTQTSIYDFTYN